MKNHLSGLSSFGWFCFALASRLPHLLQPLRSRGRSVVVCGDDLAVEGGD